MIYSKLALRNIKRSIKDYLIYFLTLVFGVAIFYAFNSIQSQSVMLNMNESQSRVFDSIGMVMTIASVLVSFILGFLVIYANNYLIKRRNKEFGIYMTLGMEKGHLSRVIFIETLIIGILSLGVGLLFGLFLSQGLSIVTAKLFEVDLTSFKFIFSKEGMIKTILSFGIIYIVVLLFNSFSIRKIKLINLLNLAKKNENLKIRNIWMSVIIFIVSITLLVMAYKNILDTDLAILDFTYIGIQIVLGVVGTILFFFSLSGFLLKLIQLNKKVYLKDLNMFVLRQINSKINTVFMSISLICIMLFFSVCMLASGIGISKALNSNLEELSQYDLTINNYVGENIYEDLEKRIVNLDEIVKDYVNITNYDSNLRYDEILEIEAREAFKSNYSVTANYTIELIKLSDLNKSLEMADKEKIKLSEEEYLLLTDMEEALKYLNKISESKKEIEINGKILKPNDKVLKFMNHNSISNGNLLTLVVNDELAEGLNAESSHLNINFKEKLTNIRELIGEVKEGDVIHKIISSEDVYAQSMGIGTIIAYIGIYIGGILLIAAVAILALQQLSESHDNKERYKLLRKIGVDEGVINKALFTQIAIYFMMPLSLSLVHSAIGLKVSKKVIDLFGESKIMTNIIVSLILILMVYIGYFIATYLGSKKNISENNGV